MAFENSQFGQDYPWLKSYPANIDWHAPIPARAVHDMLYDTVAHLGARPAFDFLGKKSTWRDIATLVELIARGLQQSGFKKGDKAALLLPNSLYYLVGYYGILRAGGTVVNLNPLYSSAELKHMVADSETDILITADLKMLWDKVADLQGQTRLKKTIVCDFTASLPFPKNILFKLFRRSDLAHPDYGPNIVTLDSLMVNDGRPVPVTIDPHEDVAVLQYTGGTTGEPKAAMLTHANITSNVEQARLWFPHAKEGQERTLGVIPFFHVFAMTAVMNLSVRCGFEIVATPRFDLKDTLKTINRTKPGLFPAVPAIYNAINNAPKAGQYDLSSLKYCISGGAPLPAEVKKQFEAKTGATVVEGYGLTESSPVACCNLMEGLNKPGGIGLPFPGTVVEIRDPETGATMPLGERGEVCVKGPQVMKGYWKKPEETAKVFHGDFLRTGDIAVMDADGYVFIVDRIKDMIITNGYKVYPRNVEEVIYQNPKVEECIVAGLPDPSRGEYVKAWVKAKAGQSLTEDELKEFIKGKISPMEMPRKIEIRDKPLPKTMIGKLSRKDIVAEETAQK